MYCSTHKLNLVLNLVPSSRQYLGTAVPSSSIDSRGTAVPYCTIVQEQIVRLGFSNSRKVLHFCMWKFVGADKANRALSAQTNFHIQKYDGLENKENPSRALEVELSDPRVRAARAMQGENLRKFTKSRARAPYHYDTIICSGTMVQHCMVLTEAGRRSIRSQRTRFMEF